MEDSLIYSILINSIKYYLQDVLQMKHYILKKFGGVKKNATQLLVIERNVIPTSVTWYVYKISLN